MENSGSQTGHDFQARTEVFVVDNHSSDGSIDFLQSRFPFVRFIANTKNAGFAWANNQVLQQCCGKYILFLNPDTILPEDAFEQCFSFMEAHPDAGGLGVRMIDGSGQYLPESKRGFPSSWVSFCKMSGLTKLFPYSELFARYYLGHLSPDAAHRVDVLSGAFMWVRKTVLDKTGGFDERFFMYAEDIDLSYRIQQAGYHNYYLPTPTIIHFKGESTRRDAQYVRLFYTAMIQFVQKHYRGAGAWWYIKLLQGIIRIKSFGAGRNSEAPDNPCISNGQKITLSGDKTSMENMQQIIAHTNNSIAHNGEVTHALILCEGATFTFTSVITALQSTAPGKRIFIHGNDTRSAVGSATKNSQGETIAW